MNQKSGRSLLQRVVRNTSWLFSGQIIISFLGLATLVLTARALGPAGIGILALVEAYVRTADRLLRLEPWQALIKYGTEALSQDNPDRFRRLVKLSATIDLLGGCLAGAVTIAVAGLVAPLVGLPPDIGADYMIFVAFGLFFSLRPTAIGVLRLFDRFDRLVMTDVAAALIRFLATVIAFYLGLGIWAFLAILLLQSVIDGLAAAAIAALELRRRGYLNFVSAKGTQALQENPGFLRFLWNSNFNVILRQSTQRLDSLVLGGLVDVTLVGYYQIGKRLMNSATKMGGPLRQVLYPEMTRLWAAGEEDRFWRLVKTTSLGAASVALLILVVCIARMESIVGYFFGAQFIDGVPAITILITASMMYLGSLLLNPTLLSMGLDRVLVRSTIVATFVFVISFVPLVRFFSIEGAAVTHVLFNSVWIVGCLMGIRASRKSTPRSGQ